MVFSSIRVIDQVVWLKLFNGIFMGINKHPCCTRAQPWLTGVSSPSPSLHPRGRTSPGHVCLSQVLETNPLFPPLCFLSPSSLSGCFAASQGDKRQQRRLGKAGIFITLSYTEALKRLLQNKSPLRPFRSGVWLIAPGIEKSLFFPRRLAGTPQQ